MIDEISLETYLAMQEVGLELVDSSDGTFLIDKADEGIQYEVTTVKELYDLLYDLFGVYPT